MHTRSVLQKFLADSLPQIHARRIETLGLAVESVTQGASVSITAMGRGLSSSSRIKHCVKRMDRLVGNHLLGAEKAAYYQAIIDRVVKDCQRPIILVDWSDFSEDRQQQLLRASLPVGGRAVTLYEELHPYALLANRTVQHRFLDQLKTLLPADCRPIVIADAGFRVPFFRYVEDMGWHWLGRIRNRDFVMWEGAPLEWVGAKSLYALATPQAQDLGEAQWVRRAPLTGRLVVIRQPKLGRKDRSLLGRPRRSRLSRKHAKRTQEPWLLIVSPSLEADNAKQIVRLYKTRMQIEENFRDTKSLSRGLGIARGRHTSFERATNLLLIAALASFVLWLIGTVAKAKGWTRMVRVNSSSQSSDYSCLFLARLVIQHYNGRLPLNCFNDAGIIANQYINSISEL